MKELLKVENLSVKLASTGVIISPNINFVLKPASSLSLVGDSGSGKTMCVSAILRLLNPRTFSVSGNVLYKGQNLFDMTEKQMCNIRGGKIALIPQNPMTAFDPSMKIVTQLVETLRLHQKMSKATACSIVHETLISLGLAEKVMKSYPHTLSGGMLQRIAIATALILKPDIVIADEATTALDTANCKIVLDELIKFKSLGSALLLITHNAKEAEYCGSEIVRIGGEANDD